MGLHDKKGKFFGAIAQVWPDVLWEIRKRRFPRIEFNAAHSPANDSPLYTVDVFVDIIRGEPGILPLVHHLCIPGEFTLMSYSKAAEELLGVYSHPELPMLIQGMTNMISQGMEIDVPNFDDEPWDTLLEALELCRNLTEVHRKRRGKR